METVEPVAVAHEPDIAWLIALWLAIHGGDPAPDEPAWVDETTALLATTLSVRLSEVYGAARISADALQRRLASIGITLSGHRLHEREAEFAQDVEQVGGRCISIDGNIWCVQPPKLVQRAVAP